MRSLLVLFLGFKLASKMPFILLGYLTVQPKSVKSSKATGTLYIEDSFAAVVCEVGVVACFNVIV